MGLLDIVRKVFDSEEDFAEFDLSVSSSDGCKGEEIIAKIINKLRPC